MHRGRASAFDIMRACSLQGFGLCRRGKAANPCLKDDWPVYDQRVCCIPRNFIAGFSE